MPDRPFPFRARGSKLQPMSTPDRTLVILVLVTVLATVALTLLFVAFPELADGKAPFWLAN
jgi:hypothetical protein